jgi:glycosyltransferase involved in cell wall biosynthesis
MKKKKLLYLITQSELGGAQRYILDLARNLKKDYDISVAFGEQGENGELAIELKNSKIDYHTLSHLKRNISPIHDYLAIGQIKSLIKKIQPDIIHLNSTKISILASWAIDGLKPKPFTVYTAHGWVFNEPMNPLKKKLYTWLEKSTAKTKDRIICISKLDKKIAREVLEIPENKLAIVYHGLDLSDYRFYPKDEARSKLWNLLLEGTKLPDARTILIGSIGNLYATKDFGTLIKAVNHLLIDHDVEVKAVIIGEGPERSYLEEKIGDFNTTAFRAGEENTDNRIILAGRIGNAANYLKAFDYYVCSSVKEGFPYTLLETMAAEVPIISTMVGGIPDLIADSQNGLLAQPRDGRQLAKKIAELINDPFYKQRIVEAAKHDSDHLFNFYRMTSETRAIYENT